jgi:HD-GYP domain-containing protein (c-di-GMP phosphodiesterase class II)
VAVCDAYEAITADRPYRRAQSHDAACRELQAGAATQFDPVVVGAFIAAVDEPPADRDGHGLDDVREAAAHVRALLAGAL